MDIDEWKKFWQNKDQKNDLNSFFSPDCKIRYDELKQEITILNFRQVSPKGISSSPYNMEQDFFGKSHINKQGNQCGPFAFGRINRKPMKFGQGQKFSSPISYLQKIGTVKKRLLTLPVKHSFFSFPALKVSGFPFFDEFKIVRKSINNFLSACSKWWALFGQREGKVDRQKKTVRF